MNATESTQTTRQRREIVIDILAETVLEMILRGRTAGSELREAERDGARVVEPEGQQPAEVCHGAG